MTLKEVIAVLDSGLNYEVYGSHRNTMVLHDSSARISNEPDKRNWLERLRAIEGKTVIQISRSQNDDDAIEIYIEEMENDDGQA